MLVDVPDVCSDGYEHAWAGEVCRVCRVNKVLYAAAPARPVEVSVEMLDIQTEYCECGCHGTEVKCGPISLYAYSWFKRGSHSEFAGAEVRTGHGIHGDPISKHTTQQEANEAARRHIAKLVASLFKKTA